MYLYTNIVLFQDETSSQNSSKESKEENLSFQVAYEMNHVDNETIKYPCKKSVQIARGWTNSFVAGLKMLKDSRLQNT